MEIEKLQILLKKIDAIISENDKKEVEAINKYAFKKALKLTVETKTLLKVKSLIHELM